MESETEKKPLQALANDAQGYSAPRIYARVRITNRTNEYPNQNHLRVGRFGAFGDLGRFGAFGKVAAPNRMRDGK